MELNLTQCKGQVGIGGYLMQGGLSYLSAQYGMAGDSIVEYETVLANGTIAHINQQNNKDLVVAMRGMFPSLLYYH
jgi:FAD/FMN-containing dehydrogenase